MFLFRFDVGALHLLCAESFWFVSQSFVSWFPNFSLFFLLILCEVFIIWQLDLLVATLSEVFFFLFSLISVILSLFQLTGSS